MGYSFNGYFSPSKRLPAVTYMANDGVRNHKPPYGSIWDSCPEQKLLTGEFIDRLTGLLTDRFYGNCTDFNDWFIGKVARGERFDVYITDTENRERVRIDEVYAWIGEKKDYKRDRIAFQTDDNGRWSLAS